MKNWDGSRTWNTSNFKLKTMTRDRCINKSDKLPLHFLNTPLVINLSGRGTEQRVRTVPVKKKQHISLFSEDTQLFFSEKER